MLFIVAKFNPEISTKIIKIYLVGGLIHWLNVVQPFVVDGPLITLSGL